MLILEEVCMTDDLDIFRMSQNTTEGVGFVVRKTIEKAKQFSQRAPESQQWQAFLNYLALAGFQNWLKSRKPDWDVDTSNSPWRELDYLKWPIVPNLIVGQLKVCLLVTEMVPDEDSVDDTDSIVEIPQEFLQNPGLANHLYVVVSVLEEDGFTVVQGYLRYDHIQTILQQPTPADTPPGTIGISFSQLDPDLNHLLLYLRLPEFAGITLPDLAVSPTVAPISSVISETLAQVADLSQAVVKSINLLATELQGGWTPFEPCKTKLVGAMLSSEATEERIQKWAEKYHISDYKKCQASNLLLVDDHEICIYIAVETLTASTVATDKSTGCHFILLLQDKAVYGLPDTIQIDLVRLGDNALETISTARYNPLNRRLLACSSKIDQSQTFLAHIKVSNQIVAKYKINCES